jgi:hypothetical protein
MIRSIPRLLVATETKIPITKIPMGTKSSIGMLYLPTLLLDLRFAERAPKNQNINYYREVYRTLAFHATAICKSGARGMGA